MATRSSKGGTKKPALKKKLVSNTSANGPAAKEVVMVPRPTSPLRGIVPTPPEVADLVEREIAGRPVTPEALQRVMDGFKLQYYFGGNRVAYRHTPQGKEVLAVGEEEIARLWKKRMSVAARNTIRVWYYDPWYVEASELR